MCFTNYEIKNKLEPEYNGTKKKETLIPKNAQNIVKVQKLSNDEKMGGKAFD